MSTDLNMEYQEVKFGEIANHISKRVEPSETTLEIYVGLEHLNPDSLKITRHGVPSDVAGQKLLVKKGQIIFGKRRAYQRKVAVADWDCICSAHAMVLEAVPGKVLPEFLPFFMQSNQFMERAVDISEGSLSPTIKWKILEQQSFQIPSLAKQENLLGIFKSILKVKTCEFELKKKLSQLSKVLFNQSSSGRIIGLGEIININYGKSPKGIECENGKYSIIGTGGITGKTDQYLYEGETIIIGRKGTLDNPIYISDKCWPIDTTFFCTVKKQNVVDLKWLYYFFKQFDFYSLSEASGVPSLSRTTLERIKINLPELDEQKSAVEKLEKLDQMTHTLFEKQNLLTYLNRVLN